MDLFYRINVFPIRMPPLRERLEDLPLLVPELLDRLVGQLGLTEPPGVSTGFMQALAAYNWPGNIRELRNVLERTVMVHGAAELRASMVDLKQNQSDWQLVLKFCPGLNLHTLTRDVARDFVREALRRSRTKKEAAEILGLSRHAFTYQLKILDLKA